MFYEGGIKYLPRGSCAVITCFLKGAVEASVSNCNVGEPFLKGMRLELSFEGQIRIKEMKSGGVRGKSSRQRKWHEQKRVQPKICLLSRGLNHF